MFEFGAVVVFFMLLASWLLRGAFGRWAGRKQYERATLALERHWPDVEQQFLSAAAATGKPRGLIWSKSKFHEAALLARDKATGDLYALVGITIAFEAVLGGDMEEVEAVSNLRCATALLEWKNAKWTTAGRVLFNMEPDEALEHYPHHLQRVRRIELSK